MAVQNIPDVWTYISPSCLVPKFVKMRLWMNKFNPILDRNKVISAVRNLYYLHVYIHHERWCHKMPSVTWLLVLFHTLCSQKKPGKTWCGITWHILQVVSRNIWSLLMLLKYDSSYLHLFLAGMEIAIDYQWYFEKEIIYSKSLKFSSMVGKVKLLVLPMSTCQVLSMYNLMNFKSYSKRISCWH